MKKQLFILLTLFVLSLSSRSQTYFNNEFKNDSSLSNLGSSISPFSDSSGYMVVGNLNTSSSTYIRFIRIDINGDTVWTKHYGKNQVAEYSGLGKLINLGDTNFVFTGTVFTDSVTHSTDSSLIAFIKIDSDGNVLIEKYFGDSNKLSYGNDIQATLDGGFIITGWTTGWGNTLTSSSFLLKVDSLGNEEWHKIYGGPFGSKRDAFSVDLAENNGYIFSGRYYQSIATREDINVIKTDSLGNIIWNKVYGTNERDTWGYITKYGNTSDYILTAAIDITPGNILIDGQGFIARVDGNSGNILWDDTLGIINNGTNDEFTSNAIVLSDGTVICIGITHFSSSGGGVDAWLVKYDGNGNLLWQRTFNKNGGNNHHYFWDVQPTYDKGFIICGDLTDFSISSKNIWVLKLDSMGCEIPNCAVGVEEELNLNEILVYPNPANDLLNVTSIGSKNSIFKLFDITGKEIIQKKLTSSHTSLDVSFIPKGIYFYQIYNQEKRLNTGKLVIQ